MSIPPSTPAPIIWDPTLKIISVTPLILIVVQL